MPTKVRCPNPDCGQSYSIASETVSGKARCKKCGSVFEISSSVDRSSDPSLPLRRPAVRGTHPSPTLGRFLIRAGSAPVRSVRSTAPPTRCSTATSRSRSRQPGCSRGQGRRALPSRGPGRRGSATRTSSRSSRPASTATALHRHRASSTGRPSPTPSSPDGARSRRRRRDRRRAGRGPGTTPTRRAIVHRDVKPANVMLDERRARRT